VMTLRFWNVKKVKLWEVKTVRLCNVKKVTRRRDYGVGT
jgi:hypothetical protein